jgi:Protein of unknown function (DUF2612).
MSELITDYSSEQRKYVPEQYKRSTKLLGVIDATLGFSDELEKALREISDNFNIEDAVGPMLDYYGLYFGIVRKIGETDEQLRMRIRIGSGTEDLPTPEAIYNYFKIAFGISDMILCPVWPAGLYFVLDQGMPEPDVDEVTTIAAASGVDIGQGTFLCCEEGEPWGLIVLEDNGQSLVIDQRWPDTEYAIVDETDEQILIKDSATEETTEPLLALDY